MKAVLVLIGLTACASAGTASLDVEPLPCPAGGLPAEARSAGLTPPLPDSLFLPPMPPPPLMRGVKADIRAIVDAQGKAFADSITVCGVRERQYARQLAAQVARMTFHPAQRDGRPVAAPWHVTIDFPRAPFSVRPR